MKKSLPVKLRDREKATPQAFNKREEYSRFFQGRGVDFSQEHHGSCVLMWAFRF